MAVFSTSEIGPMLSNITSSIHDFVRSFFTLVGLFVIFWYTWEFIKSRKGKPLSPPGPRGLPLVGSLPFLKPDLHCYFAELARTYGPVVKLQLGSKIGILVTSPSAAREVLKDQDIVFANRDVPAVAMLATGGRDIGFNSYGPEWRMLRKAGPAVNIGEQMFLTTLNVVTNMLWGGTLEGEVRESIGAEFRHAISEFTEILGLPNISDFFPALAPFDLQGLMKRMRKPVEKLNGIIDKMIDQRLKLDNRESGSTAAGEFKDFLQFLIQLKDGEDSQPPMTMNHIKALLQNPLVAIPTPRLPNPALYE
ncbi:Cytochrome P450 [Corchorus capsularis]|uniref:Cytochrome P450 n=1 Tax=Corchorus capsularis TaxID=210143 RepID=A0A1R3K550_COCAP|nr:Cytochrome P450 [Corchorus capsularis]